MQSSCVQTVERRMRRLDGDAQSAPPADSIVTPMRRAWAASEAKILPGGEETLKGW